MRELQISPTITNREHRSVEVYFSDIAREAMISAQEEVILSQKIRQGDQAALQRLVKANLRFVVSVAKKYQHQGLPLNDLISEGNIGLVEAARRFDETRGFKFISYAVWWIRQAILAAIAEKVRIVRLPLNKVDEITAINKAAAKLEQQLGREPMICQLAEYMEIPDRRISEALSLAPFALSFERPLGDEDDYCLQDRIAAPEEKPFEYYGEDTGLLLSVLSTRERKVIELSYGMTGGRELNPREIALEMGLHTERIRQIKNEALKKLREAAIKGMN